MRCGCAIRAIGLNYVEVSQRRGNFLFRLPFIPGNEGAGTVEEVGAEVTGIKVGDRVVYAPVPECYSEIRVIPAERLILMPDSIDDHRTAAAMMLQGMTAQYLRGRSIGWAWWSSCWFMPRRVAWA